MAGFCRVDVVFSDSVNRMTDSPGSLPIPYGVNACTVEGPLYPMWPGLPTYEFQRQVVWIAPIAPLPYHQPFQPTHHELSDADVERIARRVAELIKGQGQVGG